MFSQKKLILFFSIPLIFPIICAIFSYFHKEDLISLFLKEDNILETISVFIWLSLFIIFFLYALKLKLKKLVFLCYLFASFLSFIVAMEEISWGQRIFNIETPDFLLDKNAQKEINLHNIQIGEKKINRIILQRIMPALLIIYFIIIPILLRFNNETIIKLKDYFYLPTLPLRHLPIFLLYLTITFTIIDHSRKGELAEFYIPYVVLILLINNYSKVKQNSMS